MKSDARRRSPLPSILAQAIISFCLAAGGLFCLITAFHLPVRPAMVLIPAALCSLAAAALARFRWSTAAFLAAWILGLGAVLLWDRYSLEEGLRCAYTAVSTAYSNAYSFPFPLWKPGLNADCSLLFLLWSLGAVCLISWAIYQRSAALATAFSVVPLVLCLVVVDTPPDTWCLLMLLSAILLLIFTQSCRRRSTRGAGVLALILLVPVAALVCGLCAAMPPDRYQRGQMADQALKNVMTWLNEVSPLKFDADGGLVLDFSGDSGPATRTLSLEVGPRQNSGQKVMEVRCNEADSLYLRGCTYGNYTGTAWRQLADASYQGLSDPAQTLTVPLSETVRTISVRTQTVHDVIYTPYYLKSLPDLGEPQQDSYLYNDGRLREYSFTYYVHLSSSAYVSVVSSQPTAAVMVQQAGGTGGSQAYQDYTAFAMDYYTRLPEETRQSMLGLAEEAGLMDLPVSQLPYAVAGYVRESAAYDLNTPQMPDGADFATWFLTESDTGYCLHFATATAVMLRALGIPARLVSGYLVDAPAGEWTEVAACNAHAWVEYYNADAGWLPLESTPSAGVEETMGHSASPAASQPTAPQEPTEPSLSSQPQVTPTAPEGTAPAGQDVERQPLPARWRPPAWLLWLLLAAALFLLRRPAVLKLRQRRLSRGDFNRQLLAHWAYGCRLASRLGEPPLSDELPLKARFSQHAITREELCQVTAWEAALRQKLLGVPGWKRLYYQWILVLV